MRTIIRNQAFLRMGAIGLFGTLALNMLALIGAWEVVKGISR